MISHKLLGHLYATIIVVIWGLTFVSCKILLRDFSPTEILFDRFVIATLVLALIAPHAFKYVNPKVELYSVLVGLYGVTLYFVFENNALTYSNTSNVSLIVSTAPFFVGLLNNFLEKDSRLTINFYLGFFIAICGIAFLSFGTLSLNLNPLGDMLAIGCAVVWGLYSFYVVKLQRLNVSSLMITAKSFFYSVLLTLPLMLINGYQLKLERLSDSLNIANYVFLGVIASSLSFFLWAKSVEYIGSVKTNLYLYAVPVVTAVGAVILIDEVLTVYSVIGIVLALSGLGVSQVRTLKRKSENT